MNRHSMPRIGEVTLDVATWNPIREAHAPFRYVDLSSVSQGDKEILAAVDVEPEEAPSRARQLVQTDDVLVSTVRPNLNAVAIVTSEFDGATASTGFCVLRPSAERVEPRYLFHWVRTPQFVGEMVRNATGASYPAVSDRIIKKSVLPLPPIGEQRRIAAILDKADALRQKRKRAVALLGSLTQSIFLEMFGNPKRDTARWPILAFDAACVDETSKSDKIQRSEFKASGKFPIIDQGQAFIGGWTNENMVCRSALPVVVFGDHTRIVKYVEEPFVIGADGAKVLKPTASFDGLFFSWLLRLMPLPNLGYSRHMRELKRMLFWAPPIGLQREFSDRVRKIEARDKQCHVQLAWFDAAFSALQHHAFSRERLEA